MTPCSRIAFFSVSAKVDESRLEIQIVFHTILGTFIQVKMPTYLLDKHKIPYYWFVEDDYDTIELNRSKREDGRFLKRVYIDMFK